MCSYLFKSSKVKTNVAFKAFLHSSVSTQPAGTTNKFPSGENSNLLKYDLKVSSWKYLTCFSNNGWSSGTGSKPLPVLYFKCLPNWSKTLQILSLLTVLINSFFGSQQTP